MIHPSWRPQTAKVCMSCVAKAKEKVQLELGRKRYNEANFAAIYSR